MVLILEKGLIQFLPLLCEKYGYDVVQGFSPVKNKSSPKGLHYKV